jgi:hypothetical protein
MENKYKFHILLNTIKVRNVSRVLVAHIHNPSYSGGSQFEAIPDRVHETLPQKFPTHGGRGGIKENDGGWYT